MSAPSLVLSGFGELIYSSGGSVYLSRGGPAEMDFGVPADDTATVQRLLLDGDVVTFSRAGNRTLVLPLIVPSNLAAQINALAGTILQDSYTLTFTPAGGLPIVFDCYPGRLDRQYSLLADAQNLTAVTLTIPAAPYVRTADVLSISSPTLASTQIESFDATTGMTFLADNTGATSTASKVEGTGSLSITDQTTVSAVGPYSFGGPGGTTTYQFSWSWSVTRTGLTAVDLSSRLVVGVRVLLPNYGTLIAAINPVIRLYSGTAWAEWAAAPIDGSDASVAFRLLQADGRNTPLASSGTFDPAAVTGYQIRATLGGLWGVAGTTYSQAIYFDDLRAYPSVSGTLNSDSNVIRYDGILGIARTPVSFTCVPAAAIRTLLLARSPGQPANFAPLLNDPTSAPATTADATAFGGNYYALNNATAVLYRRPASSFNTGTFIMLARVRRRGGGSASNPTVMTVTVSITGDTVYTQTLTRTISVNELNVDLPTFGIIAVGEITLPPRPVPGQNTTTTVDISINSGSLDFDEAYLASTDGDVLLVMLPSGSTIARIWLDAPGPAQFAPAIYGGAAADRSDAVSLAPWVIGSGGWNFTPGTNHVLAVFGKSDAGGTLDVAYYPRWIAERPY